MNQQIKHTTYTNTPSQLTDMQRIARSLQRYALLRQYSQGTFKRSAMAKINLYIRQSSRAFALTSSIHHSNHDLHIVM